jgi:trehalose/maltose hydrolase-like predicted phosphorylase/O-glycosyl hydrolase
MRKLLIGFCTLTLWAACDSERAVEWVVTTPDAAWQRQDVKEITFVDNAKPDATVCVEQPLQEIEGFGACFNELGWTSLGHLSEADRDAVMHELFSPGVGANLAICRMPVGANDFSRDWYSYNETEGDFDMNHFSIANDCETLVPFIRQALRYSPGLRIWASPWSPPTWMKDNEHYACQPLDTSFFDNVGQNGIRPGQVRREGVNMFIQEEAYFKAYALYFARFIEAYRAEGISISMVMPQNEFNSCQPFPSCTWRPSGLATFVGKYLGPKMEELGVEVMFGTMERPNPALVDTILADPDCRKYITGVGFQWAGKEALPDIHRRYPRLKIYQTEQECGDGKNDWEGCAYSWDLMKHYFNNGANVYDYWNISLEAGGMSRWGWRQNSLVVVNREERTYNYTYEYYLMKHASHYVQPGARFLPVSGEFTDMLAFRNPDGKVVLIAHNAQQVEVTRVVRVGERNVSLKLRPQSFNTVVLSLTSPACLETARQEAGDEGWNLRTSDWNAPYVGAPVANGGIGILPWREPFSIRHVVLNHVFDADGPQGVSKVLRGINPFLLEMQIDGERIGAGHVSGWEQRIDLKEASHNTRFVAADKARVGYSVYALRNMPCAGMIRIEVEALADVELCFVNTIEAPDDYAFPLFCVQQIDGGKARSLVFRKSAFSKHRRRAVSASSAYLYNRDEPGLTVTAQGERNVLSLSLRKGRKVSFALAGAVCSDREFIDPYNESDRQVIYAAQEGAGRLIAAHRLLWNELWKGDIIIEGDDEAQRAVRFALYNLYSYVREGSGLSISPMGLSSSGYNGHIFWDSELWMYPPLLCLNPGIARSMIDYRTDRLPAACAKARAYGYRGAMFPWESDDAGEEACPTWALTGPFEHHITADIAIAAWNYYCVTRDREWLLDKGYPLLAAVADFWLSRSEKNADGTYSIRNVVCADEYAEGVDDNAFTNGAAIRALQAAVKAADVCGRPANTAWRQVADGLVIPTFGNGITREHATYDGRTIKQADANLLGYPLGIVADPARQQRDMEYYVERIDTENGPAMSYSVFCVQYARLGKADRAYEMFLRSYRPNSRPPFGVIAETATSDNPYFATGAGGMLQAVINGFCGLEVTDKGICQRASVLPPHWKRLTVTGVGTEGTRFSRTQAPGRQ